jgi:serine/threonine-protein kinase
MFSGTLPEWPFTWPPEGYDRLRRKLHPELIRVLERALDVNPRRRFSDAEQMLEAFQRCKRKAIQFYNARHRSSTQSNGKKKKSSRRR